ncbi:IS5 family transposase [Legionella sp. PATHC038]|uniref:IS5 family transposase n=1 Tax=Legionella sheltonii TaxID=2992041 RepID=UPI002243EFB1|nr:IS5 family transposase [Legionella sp. PATHC038]MCW8397290.1 IS5 family transposase [Legionella sp. PATHC038]
MARLMLRDELWSKLKEIMLQHQIYDKPNVRMMVEAMLYRMRVGCPWRDLPKEFGFWNSAYQQFNRWSSKNKLMMIFKALIQHPALEWEFIDGRIVRAHQHSSGAIGKKHQAIGKSVGGNTTKIHRAVDACRLPIEFQLTGGEVHDAKAASGLIETLPKADYTIADKGYDSEEIRDQIRQKSSTPMIPRKTNSKTGNADIDWGLYKYRHLVENVFARLKHFRAVATRDDKLKRNDASMLAMACSYIWLPM